MSEQKWIPVAETKLAKDLGGNLRSAGMLFKQAGFKKSRHRNRTLGEGQRSHVESRAADLDRLQITTLVRRRLSSGEKTPAVQRSEASLPSYAELVETIERQDKIIHELQDENRQLRQHLASANSNGMGDRARKALTAAKRTLEFFKD